MSAPDPGTAGSTSAGAPDQGDGDGDGIGWGRAILSGLAILVVGLAGTVIGANAILTKSLALTRAARVGLSTALFFVVIVVVAWVLRRLQDRKLI